MIRLLSIAAALAAAAWLVDGITLGDPGGPGPGDGAAALVAWLVPLLVVAAILGLVTAVVKPVLALLALPLIVVTLGLFLLVINAGMLLLTGWIAARLDLAFTVDGFWPAVAGAVVITVVTWALDLASGR